MILENENFIDLFFYVTKFICKIYYFFEVGDFVDNVQLVVLSTGKIRIVFDENIIEFFGEIGTDGFYAVVDSMKWINKMDNVFESDNEIIKKLINYYSNCFDKNNNVIFVNSDWCEYKE